MIGTRTPFRISFAGGGSDLKEFYSKHTGCVLSASINKYMYILVHQFFNDNIQIKYSKTELVDEISKIQHPIVREVLTQFNIMGIDINSIADVPSGTGLGSSSAYTVGLLHAINAYCNKYTSSEYLAKEACKIEIDILGEPIGKQDQYAVAYGGLNLIKFYPDENVDVEPIIMSPESYLKLEGNLLMFYTGLIRSASDILIDQKKNIENSDTFNSLIRMTELAGEMKKSLVEDNFQDFGRIMDENWHLKKSLSKKISESQIDDFYSKAIDAGALGGKLLGAGGGGFLIFYCEKENHEKLRNSLSELRELKFKFDRNGSKIIYIGDLNENEQ